MRRTLVNEVDARILPNLRSWYVAENHANKFSDGIAANHAMDDAGKGNNLGGAGTAPLFKTGAVNGYAAWNFDGTKDLRNDVVYSVAGAFAVVKHNIAGNWLATFGEGFVTNFTANNAGIQGAPGTQVIQNVPGTDTIYINGVQTATVTTTNIWNLYYIEFTAANRTFTGTMFGRIAGTSGFLNGQIAEAGTFGSIPSAQQRSLFFSSMIAKYKLPTTA